MKSWGWFLAGMSVAVGVALWVWYRGLGRTPDATRALSEGMVDWHRQVVASKKAQVEKLMKELGEKDSRVLELMDGIDAKKADLQKRYIDEGLSDDEIVARFARIGL